MSDSVEIHIAPTTFSVFIIERFSGLQLLNLYGGPSAWARAGGTNQIDILFPDNFRDKLLRLWVRPDLSELAWSSPGRAVYGSGDLLLQENAGGEVYDLIQVSPGAYAIHFEKSGEEDGVDIYDLTLFDRQSPVGHTSGPPTAT
ncbi:hypothetical protein JL108_10805 [Aeromicrobium sp. YIM 150415]|uniref:hypothetical protein n=1 Tax=Aeromicrobium sp. YIM 150415 TaxID=2803912 RepID=UPI0019666D8F|nr:hypothetical protein [Aeromicrobium sp. YIM 150415]MBM9463936.1 hypothetical protein [Aeromicrobium sp. YIM 150415]